MNCIDAIGNNEVFIFGDCNCVLDSERDYYNYKSVNNANARDKVLEMMNTQLINTQFLLDPFRETTLPHMPVKFTWRKRNNCKQARLDFFLISETFMQYVNKSTIESSYRSHHSIITLNFTNISHGKS